MRRVRKKGKGSCGCGTRRNAAKAPPPECEPTLTCESYSFAAWKAPKPAKDARKWGAAATRFICCVRPFLTAHLASTRPTQRGRS